MRAILKFRYVTSDEREKEREITRCLPVCTVPWGSRNAGQGELLIALLKRMFLLILKYCGAFYDDVIT